MRAIWEWNERPSDLFSYPQLVTNEALADRFFTRDFISPYESRELVMDGSFTAPVTVVQATAPTPLTSYALTSSDFDGDGKPDVAFASGSEIAILYNVAPPKLRVEPVGYIAARVLVADNERSVPRIEN